MRPILLNLLTLDRSTPRLAVVSLFLFCFSARIGFGAAQPDAAEAFSAQPAAQIDLLPLGFGGLSASARQTANVTVDFLDIHHVLLTFNPKKLFRRLPDCPPTHDDRVIHAMVLEVPGGRVVRETDWYLHDARRFVWPMGSGRVLLRRLNKLYEVDSSLAEKLAFDSPKELLWVSVTPDGKQIITETSEGSLPGGGETKGRVKISFLDADSLAVQRVIQSRDAVRLEATSSGFADVRKKGNAWLIRFGPVNIARIKGVPNILYSSVNTMLIGRCSVSRNGYNVSAFTVTGNSLWRERWSECRYSPAVRRSEDGSRFAFGTIAIPARTNPPASAGGINPEEENLAQTIQVFDTASGNSLLSLRATQAVLDGQNFSLSPDGRQLAAIVGSAMKIYSLRGMSAGERAKYIAVKSDTPGLYVPAAKTDKAAAEEPLYASAAEEEPDATEQQSPVPNSSSPTQGTAKPSPGKGTSLSAGATAIRPTSGVDASMLTLRSVSQIVVLDVVMTDSKGHVVKGLQQADFIVAEDGKPQRVSYFSERTGAQSSPSTSPASPPAVETLPANIFSNQSQPVEPGSTTVVLLDLLNTPLTDQSHAQEELVNFIKGKPKDSQFALFTLANRLQMIQGFTQDGNVLLAAANGKKASLRHRPLMDSDTVLRPSLEAGMATAKFLPKLDFFVQSLQLQESEVRVMDADQRVSVTLDAFAHLARYLSGIPGRKNLVWLSGSFPLSIYPGSSGQTPFLHGSIYGESLKKAANLLAEAHVAVYPVAVKGLATDPLFSAASNDLLAPLSMQGSTPATQGTGGGGPRGRVANMAVPIAMMQNQAEQFASAQAGDRATMNQLAAQTGGQAFYNTNSIAKAINTAAEEGSNYYALSYTPLNKKTDGAFRKVKVSLAGKKYRLAYRSGYYAVDPRALAKPSKDLTSSLARAAMQQGSPQSRQVVFGARVVPLGKPRMMKDAPGRAKPSKRKRKDMDLPVEVQRYSIDYAVIPADLRFAPTLGGTYRDVLNFMITAFDDDGNLVASQVSQMIADLKPETVQDVLVGGLRLHQEIDVPITSIAMRLGVEDTANSHLGTLEISLPVKPPPDAPTAEARKSLPPIEPD
ncbi:MAG TPA: VWA domain-containing protein [Acidobacteriota bacterium]